MPDLAVNSRPAVTYVEVALPLPLRQTFTYKVPFSVQRAIQLGDRVLVPFGKRHLTGYSVALHDELPSDIDIDESAIKEIVQLLDSEPIINSEILRLTKWTADYYLASWGEVLKASLPAGINVPGHRRDGKTPSLRGQVQAKRQKAVRLKPVEAWTEPSKPLNEQQQGLLEALAASGGTMLFTHMLESLGVSGSVITTLEKRGYLEVYVQEIYRDPLDGAELPAIEELILNREQTDVLHKIIDSLETGNYGTFLLHGVTGSGKTEVYIRAMKWALGLGRSSMMLVPEIALTPVFSRRLRAVFGSDVAILHSNLSAGERFDEWRRIRAGEARIVIGTRSAVFAPLENIGLIIVDEEHDSSYRQHESPFYHARDVSVMRANLAGATVVLGSATPAMETYYNAKSGKYKYLHLPSRIGSRRLAVAEVVDMREVFKKAGKDVAFSPQLLEAIEQTHLKNEQSIILLNRRGFSQFVLCRSCGETQKCPNCDITLTFHRREGRLICHYCNFRAVVPEECPLCKSEFLYFIGEGTEQVEDILERRSPKLRIARIDRDTMSKRRELEKTLHKFARHEIDLLVGTQMLAKGHDFPKVTLVGVISVDLGLGLPDLRSAERTFQLLTQVAGRAGRGELPGQVLIQTYYPEHYAIRHAREQDYEGFYAEEIRYRERLCYPPFFVLASILVRHSNESQAKQISQTLRKCLDAANADKSIRITGPAPASISRLKGEYRIQMLLRSQNRRRLRDILDIALTDARSKGCDMRPVHVEIDPVSML
jgi:primosomal protein N' (replication factor Y)